jgi:hypothetical protein
MDDLFSSQGTLFDAVPDYAPEKREQRVRARLLDLLETARAAERMPWERQRAEVNEILFKQSSNWLPETERESLRAAFEAEMKRLRAADWRADAVGTRPATTASTVD